MEERGRMRIAVIGAGHVGTVCGACLAALDHDVTVIDVNEARIADLRAGRTPFVEPGLGELVGRGLTRGNLSFETGDEAIRAADVVFLCVNTDNTAGGSVDLAPLESAVSVVARAARSDTILVNRSTAPVGTAEYVRTLTEEVRGAPMPVAVNPEFLAEGTAVRDFLAPDRVLVGAFEEPTAEILRDIYEPILERRLPGDTQHLAGPAQGAEVPYLVSDPASAELAKYASNSMLAVKISFINEIAEIAEELGADVTKVARAVGLDRRIGPHFLQAGIGWGGSCFPKDIVALQGIAATRGLSARILRAANDVNEDQRTWVIRRLQGHFKTLFGRRVGLLGLAFKPNTDDLRSAPALEIARQLAGANVHVKGFDPVVKAVAGHEDVIELADDVRSLATGTDAVVLVTDWPEFKDLDLADLRRVMRTPLILDGRNVLDPAAVRAAGFTYLGVGRMTRDPLDGLARERTSANGVSSVAEVSVTGSSSDGGDQRPLATAAHDPGDDG